MRVGLFGAVSLVLGQALCVVFGRSEGCRFVARVFHPGSGVIAPMETPEPSGALANQV